MDNFEINRQSAKLVSVPEMDTTTRRRMQEACGALVFGKDTGAALAPIKDKMAAYLKERGQAAADNDFNAACEINAVVTLLIEPPALQIADNFGIMANYHELAYNEVAEIETWKLEGVNAREQAYNGDVGFHNWEYSKYQVPTTTISAGAAVDYRELAMGNFDSKMPQMILHINTDIHNQTVAKASDALVNAVKKAANVKFFAEYTGDITQAAVDAMLTKVRRLSPSVTISGDFSNLAIISGWAGAQQVGATVLPFYTDEIVNQIMNTGLATMYKGSRLAELSNPYNLLAPLASKDGFETYFPTDRLFFIPQGINCPLHIFRRGGLTSMTAPDIKTGRYINRYDLEFGVDVVKDQEYQIGVMVKAAT